MKIPLLALAAIVLQSTLATLADTPASKPNILLILVDDVGYGDIGAFATRIQNTDVETLYCETPRLNRLASEGTMFTQFYTAPVCSPTRASLLTGKMSNRIGMWDAYAKVFSTFEALGKPVPPGAHILDYDPWIVSGQSRTTRGVTIPVAATALHGVKTLPEGLTGYHSAFVGKWHLGSHDHEGYRPKDRGFDEVLAYFDGGGSGYYRPFRATGAKTNKWEMPGEPLAPPQDYLSDDIAQRVTRFLTKRATEHVDEPFFLFVSHPAAHQPIEPRADDLTYFQRKAEAMGYTSLPQAAYAGVIKGMDRSIGRMLDALDTLGLGEDTLVVFLSDNGGHPRLTSSAPLRGGKSMLYEGGIRVPMIVRWPGKIQAGAVCNTTSAVTDIYPTLMDFAGVNFDDFKFDLTTDGASLVPLFKDLENSQNLYPRDSFYWFYGKQGYGGFHDFATWAVLRKGDYKLHYDYQGQVELYNIVEDISETHDLAYEQPRLALEMLDELTGWLSANCSPAHLPEPNPDHDPSGPLPYGPYVPLETLRESLFRNAAPSAFSQEPN